MINKQGWRPCFQRGKWLLGVGVDDKTETLYIMLYVCGPFRIGYDAMEYDGYHQTITLGFLKLSWCLRFSGPYHSWGWPKL